MSAPTCTFDGLNINDGTVYSIMPGVSLGAKKSSFTAGRTYGGLATQTQVSTASLLQVVIPMRIDGTSIADLASHIAALNAKIVSCTSASPKSLVYAGTTYSIVASDQIAPDMRYAYMAKHWCLVDLILNRTP